MRSEPSARFVWPKTYISQTPQFTRSRRGRGFVEVETSSGTVPAVFSPPTSQLCWVPKSPAVGEPSGPGLPEAGVSFERKQSAHMRLQQHLKGLEEADRLGLARPLPPRTRKRGDTLWIQPAGNATPNSHISGRFGTNSARRRGLPAEVRTAFINCVAPANKALYFYCVWLELVCKCVPLPTAHATLRRPCKLWSLDLHHGPPCRGPGEAGTLQVVPQPPVATVVGP